MLFFIVVELLIGAGSIGAVYFTRAFKGISCEWKYLKPYVISIAVLTILMIIFTILWLSALENFIGKRR